MKTVFADTSGFYAVLDATDPFHAAATEDFLAVMLPLCRDEFVDATLHERGATRCRQARQRHLSLTDCVSLEYMKQHQIREAIARDEHFAREQVVLP